VRYLGRNFLMEIRLEMLMENQMAKRSVNHWEIRLVNWKEKMKETRKDFHLVMSLERNLAM